MIPLSWYLILAAILFGIGLFGVMARKNTISILMSLELMMNAININLLAFWSYLYGQDLHGLVFVAVIFAAAAAETAVGLALIISVYRRRMTVLADDLDLMKG
ncbi:MAG: NADH-quinone oxidoreductase subunit NuoK [Anaerolineae bacterium]|nr:NADH-quinone oxidoreductase subunit NuoK [Anaerolineae bacterium]